MLTSFSHSEVTSILCTALSSGSAATQSSFIFSCALKLDKLEMAFQRIIFGKVSYFKKKTSFEPRNNYKYRVIKPNVNRSLEQSIIYNLNSNQLRKCWNLKEKNHIRRIFLERR